MKRIKEAEELEVAEAAVGLEWEEDDEWDSEGKGEPRYKAMGWDKIEGEMELS